MKTIYEKDIAPILLHAGDTISATFNHRDGTTTTLVDSLPVDKTQLYNHVRVAELEPGEFDMMGGMALIMGQKAG
jgi:hypothetical protein